MKKHPTQHWENLTDLRGLVFFAERFDELTWAYALDSYRAPTTNPPSLIEECIRNIKLYKEIGRPAKSIAHIVEETRERLKKNAIAAKCYSLPIEKYFEFNIEEYEKSLERLTLLRRELSQPAYLEKCAEHLQVVIPTNRKSDIDYACREYASTLLNIGFNSKYLNEKCLAAFFSEDKPVSDYTSLDSFLQSLIPTTKQFSIFLDGKSSVQELDTDFASGFGVRLIRNIPRKIVEIAKRKRVVLPKHQEKIIEFKEIDALDMYGALNAAQSRLRWTHDIYGLFRHRNSVEIAVEAIVFDNETSEVCVLRTDLNHMHQIPDNRPVEANKKMGDMLVNLRLPRFSDRNRFLRVINFHGLAARSTSNENQLVNLWTALETMTSSPSGSTSIVDTAVREVLPIICLNYFYRIIRSLTLDIVRWDRKLLTEYLGQCKLLDQSDLVNKVFSLIAAEENHLCKEEMLATISEFELMRYRIFSLNKEMQSGERLLAKLERHERMVSWQVHRIYRARNQIVHSSRLGTNVESLIVSAHDYFDQVFETTAELCSGINGFNTYDEAFRYCNLRYVEYKRDLRKIGRLQVGDIPQVLWKPS